jgi:hypothetical protein
MNTVVIALALASWLGFGVQHPMPKYGVKVTADKKTDFSRLKTYSWTTGWSVFDKEIDQRIVAAVDRELAAVALTKLERATGDVVVRYTSIRRTDVDLRSKMSPDTKLHREFPVGTLVVQLLEPESQRELFRSRVDMPLETDRPALQTQIDRAIAQMFAKYPGHRRR